MGIQARIKKYSSGSHTWSDVYTAQIESGKTAYLQAVAVDASDNIYAAGSATITLVSQNSSPDRSVTELFVLKSTDHGSTWNVIDQFYFPDHTITQASGLLVAANGDVYVYGLNHSQTSFVRKSADGGTTWSTVFTDVNSVINSMIEWNGGFLILENYYAAGAYPPYIRVRGTTDNFGHLKTLDSYRPSSASEVLAGFMKADGNKYVYLTGRYTDAAGLPHAIVRATRGNGTWENVDEVTGPSSSDSLYVNEPFFTKYGGIVVSVGNSAASATALSVRLASLNSNEAFTPSSMASGTDLSSPIPAGAKRIFMTWASHDGNFGATPAAAISAADAFCEADANKPSYARGTSTFKALMVNTARTACTSASCTTSGAAEHSNWVFAGNTSYVTAEGQTIGTTNANGLFTSVSRAINSNTVYWAWTGLNSAAIDWTTESGVDNCSGWTSNSASSYGIPWDIRGAALSDIYVLGSYSGCDSANHIVCVEQ